MIEYMVGILAYGAVAGTFYRFGKWRGELMKETHVSRVMPNSAMEVIGDPKATPEQLEAAYAQEIVRPDPQHEVAVDTQCGQVRDGVRCSRDAGHSAFCQFKPSPIKGVEPSVSEPARISTLEQLVQAIVEVAQGCDPVKEEAYLRAWLTVRLARFREMPLYESEPVIAPQPTPPCADCEAIITATQADPDYDGHAGSPFEAYYEGHHICAKRVAPQPTPEPQSDDEVRAYIEQQLAELGDTEDDAAVLVRPEGVDRDRFNRIVEEYE